jgi:hypothetical protein
MPLVSYLLLSQRASHDTTASFVINGKQPAQKLGNPWFSYTINPIPGTN